jgi:hypothetical protein
VTANAGEPKGPSASAKSSIRELPLRGLRWLAAGQHEAWFAPADARSLAVCRVLLFWHIWPGWRIEGYASFAEFGSSAWYPVSFFKAWSIPLFDASVLGVMSLAANVLALCALVGFAYPLSAAGTALLSLYLRGVPQNFGKVNHSDNLLIFALLVFAFAKAADAWSVDAVLRQRLWKKKPPASPSGEYRWPVRFISLLIVTMYGAAGASKLLNSGWDWALSDSFRLLLLRHHFTHQPPTQIGVWIAELPALCKALALAALLIELSAPLALLSTWLHRLLLPALFALQVGIWLLLGVKFSAMLPLFLCMLPWGYAVSCLDLAKSGLRARLRRERVAPASE